MNFITDMENLDACPAVLYVVKANLFCLGV